MCYVNLGLTYLLLRVMLLLLLWLIKVLSVSLYVCVLSAGGTDVAVS